MMTHVDLEKIWETLSVAGACQKAKYLYPNGLDSLRIVFEDDTEIIFIYHSEKDWSVETVESFIRRMTPTMKKKESSKQINF